VDKGWSQTRTVSAPHALKEERDLCSSDLLPIGGDVVPSLVALGVGGLEAEPGDHICGMLSGEVERDQVLIPFLQAGLASGDKCGLRHAWDAGLGDGCARSQRW
jgi:hypothetical protein